MVRAPRRVGVLTGVLLTGMLSAGCVRSIEPEAGAGTTVRTGTIAEASPATTPPAGSGAGGSGTGGSDATGSDATGSGAGVAMPMPLVGGGEIDLAAYLDRPLLLWFWAPF